MYFLNKYAQDCMEFMDRHKDIDEKIEPGGLNAPLFVELDQLVQFADKGIEETNTGVIKEAEELSSGLN